MLLRRGVVAHRKRDFAELPTAPGDRFTWWVGHGQRKCRGISHVLESGTGLASQKRHSRGALFNCNMSERVYAAEALHLKERPPRCFVIAKFQQRVTEKLLRIALGWF